MTSRPRNETQVSTGLPGLHRHITGHDQIGNAIVHASEPALWSPLFNNAMAFSVGYTTSHFPPQMSGDADITAHEKTMSQGDLGLTNPSGTVCRFVDFGPGSIAPEPLMHRTQSLDYGVVIEGEVEMILDSGETRVLGKGDLAVQRGTNHAWRNTSDTEWARMLFVLQASEKVMVNGKELGEDLNKAGAESEGLRQK